MLLLSPSLLLPKGKGVAGGGENTAAPAFSGGFQIQFAPTRPNTGLLGLQICPPMPLLIKSTSLLQCLW